MKLDPKSEFDKLQTARKAKSSKNLYTMATENEKMYAGEQWDGINSKNLKHNTYNFLSQIVDSKLSSILANKLTVQRSLDDTEEDDVDLKLLSDIVTALDRKNYERMQFDYWLPQLIMDGALSGIGVAYYSWDNDIVAGNINRSIGDINVDMVDMTDFYVANSHEVDVQKQDWIKLVYRYTVTELKKIAKRAGMSEEDIDSITSDDASSSYQAFEKAENLSTDDEDKLATLVVNLIKDEDGQVLISKTTKNLVIEDWVETELRKYPIVVYTYKPRKKFIYGEAEITRYIANQKSANILEASRGLHALLMAIPRMSYNENMVNGISSAIGSIYPVNAPPGTPLTSVFHYEQPASMGIDVDKSIDANIDRTKLLAGVNPNILGESRPENAAALLTQIRQSNLPIEPYKNRLYRFLEDTFIVFSEFYKTKYNTVRRVKIGKDIVSYKGTTDFKGLDLNTKIDVGPSQQWSEVVQLEVLNAAWDRGIIKDPETYIKRLPHNLIALQEELLAQVDAESKTQELIATISNIVGIDPGEFKDLGLNEQIGALLDMIGKVQPAPQQASPQAPQPGKGMGFGPQSGQGMGPGGSLGSGQSTGRVK